MWNPLSKLSELVIGHGGFVNAHSHFDRSYSVTFEDFENVHGNINSQLKEKWKLVDNFKIKTNEETYFQHITTALRMQNEQGIYNCLSFIDCDSVVENKAILAAIRAKKFAAQELKMRLLIANQSLKGVVSKESRFWFEKSLEHVDIIGGLPGADPGFEAEHIDILLKASKETGKRVHVHVDQLNSAEEKETELLARKTIEWGLEGKVTAIHGISIAAHPKKYREELYKLCIDADLSFVACPSAWIDSRRNEILTPTHNSVTPIDEMIPLGITVALGSDNICDIFKPYSDGNMFTELRLLLEATHYYDMKELVKIATINGLKVLGLN